METKPKTRKSGIRTRREFLAGTLGLAAGAGLVGLPRGAARAGQKKVGTRPVKLRVWHTEPNPASVKAMGEIIADFQKLYPNITVEQSAIGWADMENKLLAGLAAGAPPDIAQVIQYITPSLYAKGLLLPVDDVVNAVGKNDIFPRVRDAACFFKGKYYGIVHAWGADMWIYRKDWAAAKNLKDPATWAEMYDWLKELNEPPGRYALSLVGADAYNINEDVYMFVGQNGGRIWDENGLPTLTEPPVLEMLEHYKKLSAYMPPGWVSHTYTDTLGNIATGKAACITTWGRTIGYINQYSPGINDPDHFGPMHYKPAGPSAKVAASQRMFTQQDGEQWVIFKDSKAPEEAGEFLKFFYKRENYLRYVNSVPLHLMPITKSLFKDPEYVNHPERKKWKSWLDVQYEYLDRGFTMPLLMVNPSDDKIQWLLEVANSGIHADMVFDVVKKDMKPIDAAKRADARINKLISEVAPRRR